MDQSEGNIVIKKESSASGRINLPHSCFRCVAKFANSSQLVQHMREMHSSFVNQPHTKLARTEETPDKVDSGPYKNAIATCPFCSRDCQTRKKLMNHLELEHKDDNDNEDEPEGPELKVIRLDEQHKQRLLEQLGGHSSGSAAFVHPDTTDPSVVQNFLKAIGTSNASLTTSVNTKVDSKAGSKFQYKCFWCDASFRKRGKLMDHIDSLHKHNKQQNQVEAELLSQDENGKQIVRHQIPPPQSMSSSTSMMSPLSTLPSTSRMTHLPNQPQGSLELKPKIHSTSCSFRIYGSLKPVAKPKPESPPQENICKFYFGKKGNPIANVRNTPQRTTIKLPNSRRYSLPNMLDSVPPSTYGFSYHRFMAPPTSMTAMQHNYMFAMRPPVMHHSFYQQRMPFMVPNTDFMLGQGGSMLDSSQTSPQALLARMNSMAQAHLHSSPRHQNGAESPLDLTKSYI